MSNEYQKIFPPGSLVLLHGDIYLVLDWHQDLVSYSDRINHSNIMFAKTLCNGYIENLGWWRFKTCMQISQIYFFITAKQCLT